MDDVLRGGITQAELVRGRNQLRGSYILGSESSSNRMMSIGRRYLMTGEVLTSEQVLSNIEAVTMETLLQAAQTCFANAPAIAAVGPADGVETAAEIFR